MDSDLPGTEAEKLHTGSGSDVEDQLQDELHALDLGADEFLTKPCRKERLLARVSNVLKRYEEEITFWKETDFSLTVRPILYTFITDLLSCRRIRENPWDILRARIGYRDERGTLYRLMGDGRIHR